jgi:hypothetical protein
MAFPLLEVGYAEQAAEASTRSIHLLPPKPIAKMGNRAPAPPITATSVGNHEGGWE